jgi:hypothetical protein
MDKFEFVSYEGCGAGGILRFKDNGNLVTVDRDIIKRPCELISEKAWDADDIYWLLIPGKTFNTEEKNLFLEMLNQHYHGIRAKCNKCGAYKELNQIPFSGDEVFFSSDRLTEDDIAALTH